ncbi:MAG: polyphenol oxidase family protein [Candidatus Wallbacteria bacterium]|nr:polyphenol oxidase family protein [Candidatus Wallbacteria bacterium]
MKDDKNALIFMDTPLLLAGFTVKPLDLETFYAQLSLNCRISQISEIDIKPVRLRQVHGCRVVPHDQAGVEADGMICEEPGMLLVTSHADCFPVYLFSNDCISLLHAGREGFYAGIIHSGIQEFSARRIDPGTISAIIGPGICPACHSVGKDISDRFRSRFGECGPEGHIDLSGLIVRQLLESGLRPESISCTGLCTCHDQRFHSYRRERTSLRNAAFFLRKTL